MNQIKYVEKHYRKISSATQNRKDELLIQYQSQSSHYTPSVQLSPSTQAPQSLSSSISITSLHSSTSASRQHYDVQSNRQYELSEYALAEYANPSSVNHTRQTLQSDERNQDYQTLEPYASSSSSKITYDKELSMLNKLYKEKNKFESTENNFDFKLTIYLDKCRHADLPKHAYEKGISAMLTDETLTRYYVNRANFITFNDFCISMRTYFENPE
jgi:hypothetical protein